MQLRKFGLEDVLVEPLSGTQPDLFGRKLGEVSLAQLISAKGGHAAPDKDVVGDIEEVEVEDGSDNFF